MSQQTREALLRLEKPVDDLQAARDRLTTARDLLRKLCKEAAGQGLRYAKIGHPAHKHVGKSTHWVFETLGELERMHFTDPMIIDAETRFSFAFVPGGYDGELRGQEIYQAFWDREALITETAAAAAGLDEAWTALIEGKL